MAHLLLALNAINGQRSACRGNQTIFKEPAEGQVFYICKKCKNGKDTWEYAYQDNHQVEGMDNEWITVLKLYTMPRSELLMSGKYKYRLHECLDGNTVLEYYSQGSDFYQRVYDSIDNQEFFIESKEPCHDSRVEKNQIRFQKGRLIDFLGSELNDYEIYIPPTCEMLSTPKEHCNCRSSEMDHEYTIKSGIANRLTTDMTVSRAEEAEITAQIMAAAKLSSPVELGESSFPARLSKAVSRSWLHELSSISSEVKIHKIRLPVRPGKCTMLYQRIVHYGHYLIVGTNTVQDERDTMGRDCPSPG